MNACDTLMKRRFRVLPALAGFFRDVRAGAVGVPSVMVSVMILMGGALLGDQANMVHNRDLLQAAVEAGSIAAAKKFSTLDSKVTEKEASQQLNELKAVITRYVKANLPESIQEQVKDTLKVKTTADREKGLLEVEVSAKLKGAIIGTPFWGELVQKVTMDVVAKHAVVPLDMVLAMDVTSSMLASILTNNGWRLAANDPNARINVVRKAALALVGAMSVGTGDHGHVSVGLVPFNTTVNIGAARTGWVSDLGKGHKVIPSRFGPWQGCIEHRAGADDLDLSLVTPDVEPFTSWFSPDTWKYRPEKRKRLAELIARGNPYGINGDNDWFRSGSIGPHHGCPEEIIPLTTDLDKIKTALSTLTPPVDNAGFHYNGGTMAHLGIVWARRLLAGSWRKHWGLSEELDGPKRRKVLVLLTDGLNLALDTYFTYPGAYNRNPSGWAFQHTSEYTGYGRAGKGAVKEGYLKDGRLWGLTSDAESTRVLDELFRESCKRAKKDGITVFTVSAVPRKSVNRASVQKLLADCATSADHVFVENSTPALMDDAFRKIARRLAQIRMVKKEAKVKKAET